MASTAFMSGQGFANTISRTPHIDTDKALALYDFIADDLEIYTRYGGHFNR